MKCYRDVNEIMPEINKVQQIRLLGANYEIESVFLRRHFLSIFVCFVYYVCSLNSFYFYIISFSLLYLAKKHAKSSIRMGKLRGVFRTQCNI